MAEKFVDAFDNKTGKKLAHKVPESFFDIFPTLRKSPKQKRRDNEPEAPAQATSNEKEKK